ncbi:MAG TPA: PDZ domain-containing protein, partial [Candidatus Hydrogenedentes bacterium]|nr:PDZ domain-containing protein [Candidatus Hydrogenedentota bacterium]
IARMLGNPDLRGFRITNVLKGGPGDRAGLKTGDLIVAVDEMPLTASRQEEAEELAVLIRQYAPDASVSLRILRDGEARVIPVTLEPAPPSEREMKRFRDDALELVVRDMAFRDRATRKLEDQFTGVVTEMVTSGGWADLGGLRAGDLIMEIDGVAINNVSDYETRVAAAKTAQNPRMVLKIRRGVRTRFVEIEPKWEESHQETRNHASRTP